MDKLDVRGMSCPQPVLMTKKAITSNLESLEILVDDHTAKNNILRFLKNSGYSVQISKTTNNDFVLNATK